MCTLTLRYRSGSAYQLTMNRDERTSRIPEDPPRPWPGYSHSLLAPVDGESRGTWIGARADGAFAALLNGYLETVEQPKPAGARSRGEIIPAVLGENREVEGLDLEKYASFRLIQLKPGMAEPLHDFWDGKTLHRFGMEWFQDSEGCADWTIISSSSWSQENVLAYRKELFQAWLSQGAPHEGWLPTFHTIQEPGREREAPLMARPHAQTQSITQIYQSPGHRPRMNYWPHPMAEPPRESAPVSVEMPE